MAPNGKPSSYVMQRQLMLQPVNSNSMTTKEPSIQVKKECILFSQSVMNGWTPTSNATTADMSQASADGPEPRILSKKRRDLINAEIRELQNLLPLKKSARERLSYLGILALTNTFIRKATFFKRECIGSGNANTGLVGDFSNSLSGFLLVFNRDGKILYSSDNILDYLGHTVVELASQGDSVYDIVDKEDHEMIRSQLDQQPHTETGEARRLSFFCRMSTSRYMKTQMRSWKNKIIHVEGKYHKPEMSNDWSETAFFAVCTPIESKPVTDVRHHPTPRPTEFKAVHASDMKFIEVPNTVSTLLGYEPEEMVNSSWYQWIFPEDLNQARQQHMKFVKEDGSAFACVVRMIHKNGSLLWVDITAEKSQETISNTFVCNYIVIEEDEVPYYRLHHNLLPFPDHYSEGKRRYMAANSSLLTNALNSDVGMTSPTGLTSPTGGRHPQSPGTGAMTHMTHGYLSDSMDTKTILRRQLKRKLGASIDSSLSPGTLSPGTYANGMEIFNLPPPNKMLMRRHTASELLYQSAAPGMYHTGIHPSSYHDMASQHAAMYMPPPPLLNDTSVLMHAPQHYRGGYTTITQRPIDLPIHGEVVYSPASPHHLEHTMLRQTNQNNNVQLSSNNVYASDYKQSSPLMTHSNTGYSSPSHSSNPGSSPPYMENEPPKLNHAHSPPVCTMDSPMHSPQQNNVIKQSPEENFFCDVNNIIDCTASQLPSDSFAMNKNVSAISPGSVYDGGNYSPAHSGYGSSAEYPQQQKPSGNDVTNLISYFENQFEDDQQMASHYSNCGIASSPCSMSPQHYTPNSTRGHFTQYQPCSPPQAQSPPYSSPTRLTHLSSNQENNGYSRRSSPQIAAGSRSPLQQINTSCAMDLKPYHLQYSITPHPPSSVFSAGCHQALIRDSRLALRKGERGSVDWMKKYSHMSAMEMLLSDSESNSSYYG